MRTSKQARSNIRATNAGGFRTGNRNIASAPVKVWVGGGPTNMPATLAGLAPVPHPEPKAAPPAYKPGQVSRFAPAQRKPAAPAPIAKPRKPYRYADTHEVIPTTSAGYPFKLYNRNTGKLTRHRSEAAALARITRDNIAATAEHDALQGN